MSDDLIDGYVKSGLVSSRTKSLRRCDSCRELCHHEDLNTVDVEKYGEHTTIEVCDGCKLGGEAP